MDLNPEQIMDMVSTHAIPVGLKILGGIALWIIGRWLINFVLGLLDKSLKKSKVDPTLCSYIATGLKALLTIGLVMGILGFFGVETTSFAALLAGAGLAIGTAWGGLLTNMAAGAFMVVLRPISVGDFVTAGGITGTVNNIGLFVTAIDQMDNTRAIVGNGKIFSEVITNFSANPQRRVELTAQLAHGVNPFEAMDKLRAAVLAIPNIDTAKAPEINIVEFNLAGPVIAVRPYTHTDTYWDVFFATNHAIAKTLGDAGYPVPNKHLKIKQIA